MTTGAYIHYLEFLFLGNCIVIQYCTCDFGWVILSVLICLQYFDKIRLVHRTKGLILARIDVFHHFVPHSQTVHLRTE